MYLAPAAAAASRFLAVLPRTLPKPHALDYAKSGPETPRPALPNVRNSVHVLGPTRRTEGNRGPRRSC